MSDYKLFSNISKCYYRHNVKNFGSMLCSIIFLLKVKLLLLNNSYTHNFLIYSTVVNSIGFNSSKSVSPSLSLSVQSFFSCSPPHLCFPQLSFFNFLAMPCSRPGIKPTPPAVEVQSLNHWTTREVPQLHLCLVSIHVSTLSVQKCTVEVPVPPPHLVKVSPLRPSKNPLFS